MVPILSINELKLLKDIGNKPDEKKILPIILQAQDVDLRDYLGMKFYFDIMANTNVASYQDLLSGSTFSLDGVLFEHAGLKGMLADLTMAKFLTQININITPFGAVVKNSEDSEPVDRNSLKDSAQMQIQMAGSKWEAIKLYLDNNVNLFPNYNNACTESNSASERGLKIRRI